MLSTICWLIAIAALCNAARLKYNEVSQAKKMRELVEWSKGPRKRIGAVIVALTLFAAFGFVGSMDYEDEQAQAALYCDNVKSGVWPDYEGSYVSECEKEHGPKKVEKVSF